MKKIISIGQKSFLVLLFLVGALQINAQPYFQTNQNPVPAGQYWQKVTNMSDDFEGQTKLDTKIWSADPLANGWSWDGRVPGYFSANAVTVASGKLRVTVSKYATPLVLNGKTYLYQGGIVRSINAGQPGWYYECKMKANQTEMSSTFWLMTNNTDCNKKNELDIQECVGKTTSATQSYALGWDKIIHSNAIKRTTSCVTTAVQVQGAKKLTEKNSSRYFVYGCWWKSATELRFYLDGTYLYTITPPRNFDIGMYIQMAIETYDWNPVPDGGDIVATGTWDQRTTYYEWVRTWKLVSSTASAVKKSTLIVDEASSTPSFNLSVFPNPSSGKDLKVELEMAEQANADVVITNIKGQKVFTKKYTDLMAGNNTLDISNLPALTAGLYTVQVNTEKGSKSSKVLIK